MFTQIFRFKTTFRLKMFVKLKPHLKFNEKKKTQAVLIDGKVS